MMNPNCFAFIIMRVAVGLAEESLLAAGLSEQPAPGSIIAVWPWAQGGLASGVGWRNRSRAVSFWLLCPLFVKDISAED
jgi:mannitol-specific phosphotransferase system IIBC component